MRPPKFRSTLPFYSLGQRLARRTAPPTFDHISVYRVIIILQSKIVSSVAYKTNTPLNTIGSPCVPKRISLSLWPWLIANTYRSGERAIRCPHPHVRHPRPRPSLSLSVSLNSLAKFHVGQYEGVCRRQSWKERVILWNMLGRHLLACILRRK